MSPHILFISRNYPPQVGGLEQFSYNLIRPFEAKGQARKIVLARGRRHLAWFFPHALIRAVFLIRTLGLRRVHLCDALLAPIGVALKELTTARITVTVHGLDVIYPNPLYQGLVPRCVSRMDAVVCVSRATRALCLDRGVSPDKCRVIPNSVDTAALHAPQPRRRSREAVASTWNLSLEGKTLLITVGRLIERKGVAWFTAYVMPRLDNHYVYVIVGDGPEASTIRQMIVDRGLEGRVRLTGRLTSGAHNQLLQAAHMFIMPNIQIPGDFEGFGIAVLEAGCCGLPVVASDIEGLTDSVIHGKTGYRVAERDAEGFRKAIEGMSLPREDIRRVVKERFDRRVVHEMYRQFFKLPDSG